MSELLIGFGAGLLVCALLSHRAPETTICPFRDVYFDFCLTVKHAIRNLEFCSQAGIQQVRSLKERCDRIEASYKVAVEEGFDLSGWEVENLVSRVRLVISFLEKGRGQWKIALRQEDLAVESAEWGLHVCNSVITQHVI